MTTATTEQLSEMNQTCKVCGEPAAGFHFGAFTCEGCKSFFGRTYNNLPSLNECKNGGRCVINKKTRTSCKSCRLRKCLIVGMSKSGSRYGRRSNWFKIHFLMQNNNNNNSSLSDPGSSPNNASPTPPQSDSWERVLEAPKDIQTDPFINKQFTRRSESPKSSQGSDFLFPSKSNPNSKVINKTYENKYSISINSLPVERPKSESPKEDQPFLSNYLNENVFPKELLGMYNLPSLAQRIPAFLSSPTLAQRFLYPYYPNLLSLYSGQQYLDNILNQAKVNSNQKINKCRSPINSTSSSLDEEGIDDSQPPLKMIKRSNPQLSMSKGSSNLLWENLEVDDEAKETSEGIPTGSSTHWITKPRIIKNDVDGEVVLKSNDNQNTPIDLSIRSLSPTATNSSNKEDSPTIPLKKSQSFDDSDYKVSFVIDEVNKPNCESSAHQHEPLDLSGFTT